MVIFNFFNNIKEFSELFNRVCGVNSILTFDNCRYG